MSSSATMQQAKTDATQPAQRSSQLATQHQQRNSSAAQSELSDLRPQATAQRQLQDTANNSPQSHQLNTFQQMAQKSARATQLKAMSSMMNAPAVQRVEEDAELLQTKSAGETAQREAADAAEAPKPNNTGLPDNLKSGIESLSGMSMNHVKVHYNSAQPAQLNAHAYAQGSEIHVAPGQERHLPHEAWHVVQQAQGRVRPTIQMKDGVPVNDDAGLEREADVMGGKALGVRQASRQSLNIASEVNYAATPVQRQVFVTYNPSLNVTPRKRIASVDYRRDGSPKSAAKTWLKHNAALTENYGVCNHSRPHLDILNSINTELTNKTTINQVSRTVRAWYANLFSFAQAPESLWEDTLENMSDTTNNPEEPQQDVNEALNWYLTRIADYPGNLFHWPNKVTNGGNDEPGAPNIIAPGVNGGLTYRDTRANEITRLTNGRNYLNNQGI